MSAPCLWNFPELAFGCFPLPSFFILCIQVNAGKNVCLYLGAFLHRVFYTNTHRHTHSYTRVCSHNGVLVNRPHVRWWFPKMATELKTSCRLVSSWRVTPAAATRLSRWPRLSCLVFSRSRCHLVSCRAVMCCAGRSSRRHVAQAWGGPDQPGSSALTMVARQRNPLTTPFSQHVAGVKQHVTAFRRLSFKVKDGLLAV